MNPKFNHICLDLDGTLVDQIDGYYKSIVDVLTEHNIEIPPKDLWQKALWIDDFSIMHPYCDDETIWFEITDLYCERHENISLFDHALELLNDAKDKGIKLSVATGRTISKIALDELLKYLKIDHFFDASISYGEMDHTKVVQARDVNKKPMFEHLMSVLDSNFENSIYVTDIAHDAHQAYGFGFAKVYGTTTGGINPDLFSSEIEVIDSLNQVIL